MLVDLIATLNASFPDYDFSDLRPDQFEQELNPQSSMNSITTQLLAPIEQAIPNFREAFWKAIDNWIEWSKCEIYSFIPDSENDTFGPGRLWTHNYFFVNRRGKKIIFFTVHAVSKLHRYGVPEHKEAVAADDEDTFGMDLGDDDEQDLGDDGEQARDDEYFAPSQSPALVDVDQLDWDETIA